MAVAAIMTMGALNSCGGDNDDSLGGGEGSGSVTQATNVSGIATNYFFVTGYTLDAYDLNIEYSLSDGSKKTVPVAMEAKNLATKEFLNHLGDITVVGAGNVGKLVYWYNEEKEKGTEVYCITFNTTFDIPANFVYSFKPVFTYKGDNAVVHPGSLGNDLVSLYYFALTHFAVKTSDDKIIEYMEEDKYGLTARPAKGQALGESGSEKYSYTVTATATDFVVK